MGGEGLLLPEGVPVRMGDQIVPARDLAVEVAVVRLRERPEREVPLVGVLAIELELRVGLLARLDQGRVLEAVAQAERAVVVGVVADELVGGDAASTTALSAGCGSSSAMVAVQAS